MKEKLATTDKYRFLDLILALSLPLIAFALLPYARHAGGPGFLFSIFGMVVHIIWIVRVWTPLALAIWGLFVWRSTWLKKEKTSIGIAKILLAISFVLDAAMIFLYLVSPFVAVLLINLSRE